MSAVKREEVILSRNVLGGLVLGARAARIGKPALYGLAAGGEGAVKTVITEMAEELRRAMTVIGAKDPYGAHKGSYPTSTTRIHSERRTLNTSARQFLGEGNINECC
jgi:hypothetical protein